MPRLYHFRLRYFHPWVEKIFLIWGKIHNVGILFFKCWRFTDLLRTCHKNFLLIRNLLKTLLAASINVRIWYILLIKRRKIESIYNPFKPEQPGLRFLLCIILFCSFIHFYCKCKMLLNDFYPLRQWVIIVWPKIFFKTCNKNLVKECYTIEWS